MEVAHRRAVTHLEPELLLEISMELDSRPVKLAGLARILQDWHEEVAQRSSFTLRPRPGRPLVVSASMPPTLNISIQSRTTRSVRQNCWATTLRSNPMSKERITASRI